MKNQDNIFDKIMLAIGVLLLVLFWVQFPAMPTVEEHHYASYTSGEINTTHTSKWTYMKPDKGLSPRQVISIQLSALQQNDPADSGVITLFNFSSPTNRVHLGPLNHFRLMVREPAYRTILNFKSYKTGQLVVSGRNAYQLVLIEAADGKQEAFMFILTKQRKGTYKDCWMTEGIARVEEAPMTSRL
ncbi:DUF4864 domain-containing protein [Pontibacter korlensis]|uniref:DUF4864 domain-containing protein n=1 Tax=Pontibacter korlensis TaxID=400092 RepID=A0A0E3ZDZ2_9BACT|nr:DUF4864 domain-containing protein [Pontibacter korlensis]AKD02558.1 hypothetical protein PKOR_04765 [Pontibacter korlensis]